MDILIVKSCRCARPPASGARRRSRILAPLLLGLAMVPLPARAGEKPPTTQAEPWPATVHARYRLSYNGIEVGRLTINSTTTANTYSLTGSGKVSVLFGTFAWWGGANVAGAIEGGAPEPRTYRFEWHQKKKKDVAIQIGYQDHTAADVTVTPPPRARPDTVPLTREHRTGTLDPLSAIMLLTKADNRPPCDRRAAVFDGTQRYDIVFTPKRQMRLPSRSNGTSPEIAHVCRITYEPVGGHRANADTQAYASNHDVEIMLRQIPGTRMFVPYSLTIPTAWGTGYMVAERIDISTARGPVALTD